MEDNVIESYSGTDIAKNPFIENLTLYAIWKTEATEMTTAENYKVSDEVMVPADGKKKMGMFQIGYPLDVVRKTFLFHGNQFHEDRILKLNPGALRLFLLIMFKISPDTDRVRIFAKKYAVRTKITSPTTFYGAIQALIDSGVISKYRSNIYWINPAVMFNGNRLEKYPEKVKLLNE